MDAREWVPTEMTGTLYMSDRHSTYVSALSDEEDGLICYFAHVHDVIDQESQTPKETIGSMSTWFFPRELVV